MINGGLLKDDDDQLQNLLVLYSFSCKILLNASTDARVKTDDDGNHR